MKHLATLVTCATLLILTGCGDSSSPVTATPPAETSVTAAGTASEAIVLDSRSQLLDAVATRTDDGFDVTAWWGCVQQDCQGRRAITASSDGFATAAYEKWTQRAWQAYSHDPPRWQVYDVAPIDGVIAYHYGAVGLPDGRLLVLLEHFSDDRANAPADRPHGLWVSDGFNWTTYAPHEASFTPPLDTTRAWGPFVDLQVAEGVISVRTWDNKLYVSVDGAASFREIAARAR